MQMPCFYCFFVKIIVFMLVREMVQIIVFRYSRNSKGNTATSLVLSMIFYTTLFFALCSFLLISDSSLLDSGEEGGRVQSSVAANSIMERRAYGLSIWISMVSTSLKLLMSFCINLILFIIHYYYVFVITLLSSLTKLH